MIDLTDPKISAGCLEIYRSFERWGIFRVHNEDQIVCAAAFVLQQLAVVDTEGHGRDKLCIVPTKKCQKEGPKCDIYVPSHFVKN